MSEQTWGEFCAAVEAAVPGAAIEMKDDGELVVYTGRTVDVTAIEDSTPVRHMTNEELTG